MVCCQRSQSEGVTDALSLWQSLALTQIIIMIIKMRTGHYLFLLRFLDTGLPLPEYLVTLMALLHARVGLDDSRFMLTPK